MKIVTVVGARPQFIKAAAGSRALRREHREILVHTGQHYDANMSDIFFQEMGIPRPDYNLGIAGGTHGEMTGRMLIEIEKVLLAEKPDALLVYGDTNSTLAAALAAVKLMIPVLHVEAGNRLGTNDNPEEINRICTDHCSRMLFAATESCMENLRKENLAAKAHLVGNIMYDSFLHFANQPWEHPNILDFDGNRVSVPKEYYFMTCHRQENTGSDEALEEIFSAMNDLDAPTIYAVHPRNHARALRLRERHGFKNIILTQPVGYSDSVHLTQHAKKIVTDSGGLQEEAPALGKPVLVMRRETERPEAIAAGTAKLVGVEQETILREANELLHSEAAYAKMAKAVNPYGDGHASERIVQAILWHFGRTADRPGDFCAQ